VTGIALASLRHRRTAFTASFLSVFLGSAIIMAFASMLDTAGQPLVPAADRTTLLVVAVVVGGWGAVIVASAVGAMLAVATRQRAAELALLRTAGASPGQVVTLIMGETAVVAGTAALLALPVGYGAGHLVLTLLQRTGQVAGSYGFRFGGAALGIGLGVTLAASLAAAWLTARRAARRPVREALFEAAAGGRLMSRRRLWAGIVCVALGVQSAVLALTIVDGRNVYDVQMVAAEGCIWGGIGFALLGPVLLGGAVTMLTSLVPLGASVSGELSAAAVRQRLQQAATPLMPIIVVTSAATGTLYMQAITNGLRMAPGQDDKSVATLNYVVVGMVTLFAAVMLVNMLIAVVTDRRREFAQQRLAGATRRQILRLVGAESCLLLSVGVPFGTIGSLLTVIPFSLKTTHRLIPHTPAGIYLGVLAGVVALTLAASLLTARRGMRADPVSVLRGAART
jgi:putative ABC transport system permease protein